MNELNLRDTRSTRRTVVIIVVAFLIGWVGEWFLDPLLPFPLGRTRVVYESGILEGLQRAKKSSETSTNYYLTGTVTAVGSGSLTLHPILKGSPPGTSSADRTVILSDTTMVTKMTDGYGKGVDDATQSEATSFPASALKVGEVVTVFSHANLSTANDITPLSIQMPIVIPQQ